MNRGYGHYCPTAQALAILGERWTLLVVRDLLAGEQRFTDLMQTLGGINPKQLTQRLRELEELGIVERDRETGRREVRYRLTDAGLALKPIVDDLTAWGVRFASRPPRPGEPVHPRHLVNGIAATLNSLGSRLPRPRAWTIRFVPGGDYALEFDGRSWSARRGEGDGSVVIETRPDALAAFVLGPLDGRRLPSNDLRVEGRESAVRELRAVFNATA